MIENGTKSVMEISEARNPFLSGLLAVILIICIIFNKYP